jgi:hypothetical protein
MCMVHCSQFQFFVHDVLDAYVRHTCIWVFLANLFVFYHMLFAAIVFGQHLCFCCYSVGPLHRKIFHLFIFNVVMYWNCCNGLWLSLLCFSVVMVFLSFVSVMYWQVQNKLDKAITTRNYTREMPSSNLCRDIDSTDQGFSWISSAFHVKFGRLSQIMQWPVPSTNFLIHSWSITLLFDSVVL